MHWLARSSSFSKAQGLRETGPRSARCLRVFSSHPHGATVILARQAFDAELKKSKVKTKMDSNIISNPNVNYNLLESEILKSNRKQEV